MAPATTPRGKKRENNYFDVGKQGRKTGITLKDTGIRDADGLEPIDGIFSSPEKSIPKRDNHGRKTRNSMEGSFPEPTELLSVKKVNGNPSTRLPPPGRSPIKTSLGSSPRRPPSTGPPSRIKRTSNGITPPPRVNRKLDYSPNEVTPSIEQVSGESTLIRQSEAGKNSTKISAIESSPPLETNNSVNGLIRGPEEPQIRLSSNFEDSIPFFNGDESVEIVQSDVPIDPLLTQESATSSAIVTDKGKDKPRHSDHEVTSEMQDQENRVTSDPFQGPRESTSKEAESGVEKAQRDNTLIEISPAQNAKHGKRKRKRLELSDEEPDPRKMVAGQTPVKSLPKNSFQDHCKRQAVRSLQEPVPLQSQQAQKKRARRTKEQKEQSPTKRRKTSELLPSDHDSDAQMGIPSIEEPEESYRNTPYEPVSSRANSRADSVAPSTAPGLKRPGPRSLTLLRQGTPLEEDGARMTRSGRTSVKPFKWWLNEGYEYSKGHITGVTRAEEVEQPKKKAPARRKLAGKSGSRLQSIEEDTENEDEAEGKPEQSRPNYEEEDEPAEEWEENDGTLSGIVKRYDSFMEAGTREEVETVIGFASTSIVTRDVPSADFRYAKLMSLPFFGCGLVEVPPQGFKKSKNSRKMQMVFFVHVGRVTVEIAEQEFSIGKGGVFQVPRGNNYAIRNESVTREAKIFFTQSCEIQVEVEQQSDGA